MSYFKMCIRDRGADRMGALNEEMKAVMVRSLRESYDAVLKMAEAGDPMAQYTVGLFYFWGDMLFRFQKPSKEEFDRCEKENAQVDVYKRQGRQL